MSPLSKQTCLSLGILWKKGLEVSNTSAVKRNVSRDLFYYSISIKEVTYHSCVKKFCWFAKPLVKTEEKRAGPLIRKLLSESGELQLTKLAARGSFKCVATGLLCFFKGIFNFQYLVYLGFAGRACIINFSQFCSELEIWIFFLGDCFWWAVQVAFWAIMMLVQSVISFILHGNSVTFSSSVG